jgi:hypothetical protein
MRLTERLQEKLEDYDKIFVVTAQLTLITFKVVVSSLCIWAEATESCLNISSFDYLGRKHKKGKSTHNCPLRVYQQHASAAGDACPST